MTTESDDIAFLENSDALDPIAFFKWKSYMTQEDKQRAHSAYASLTSKAQSMAQWASHAVLMKQLWDKHKNDGSILDFWTTLPKHSLNQKIQKIQDARLIKNIKRLHSRDDALSETIDAGLIQAARSEITPGTSAPATAPRQYSQQGIEASSTDNGDDCRGSSKRNRTEEYASHNTNNSVSNEFQEGSWIRHKRKFPDPTENLEYYKTLNQASSWICKETNIIDKFLEFRRGHQGSIDLVQEGIGDLTPMSEFSRFLPPTVLSSARCTLISRSLADRWPSLEPIFQRVFKENHYDYVARAIKQEDMNDPIAGYLFSIITAYDHHFKFHYRIPAEVDSQELFTGFIWPIIRGALTVTDIESRSGQSIKTNDQSMICSGLAIFERAQIYLAGTTPGLKSKDKSYNNHDLAILMRDTWILNIQQIHRYAHPPKGLAIFSSISIADETRFFQLDFQGAFRLVQLDIMSIPSEKPGFGRKLERCIRSCLEFALRLADDIELRQNAPPHVNCEEYETLMDAYMSIIGTYVSPYSCRNMKNSSSNDL